MFDVLEHTADGIEKVLSKSGDFHGSGILLKEIFTRVFGYDGFDKTNSRKVHRWCPRRAVGSIVYA